MNSKKKSAKKSATGRKLLRQKAELSLSTTRAQVKKMTAEEAQHLVHELQVHRIELEMQNQELRQTHLELENARNRYATLFDSTPVGYVILDEKGRIQEANLTFCRLLGVPRSDLLRRKFEEFVERDYQKLFRQHLNALKTTPGTQPSSIMALGHQEKKHRVQLESSLEPRETPEGGDLCHITVIDVTEREHSQHAQEEQKALMEVVLSGVMDAIVTLDEEERIVLFNEAAERMFRCSSSSVLGETIDRFIPDRFQEAYHNYYRKFGWMALASGRLGLKMELTALRADGEEFPVEATVSQVEMREWGTGKDRTLFAIVLREITDRRQAQEALKNEQLFIAAILDTATALIMVTDTEGRIIRFNRACEELTDFSLEEIQHQPFWDILVPDTEREEVKEYFHGLIEGQGSSLHENHWKTKQNELRWIAWSNTVLKDTQGSVNYFIGVGIDLTSQRKAQRALKKEQRFIADVLNTAGALVIILNPQWQVFRMNRMCRQIVRQPLQQLVGQPFWDLLAMSGEDEQGARYVLESYKAGRVPLTFESAILDKSHRLRWIQWNTTTSPKKNGEVEYIVVTGSDITLRKQAERLLQQNERQLQAILDYSPVAIWLKDLDGRYLKVNRQFAQTVGLSEDEILGKTDMQIFPATRAAKLREIDQTLLQTRQVYEFDEEILRSDGVRIEHVFKFLITTSKGKPYALCGISTDITERKQAETLLQEAHDHLQTQQQELRALASQLLMAQEEERRRISRDLHDDVNQRLALLSLKLQMAQQEVPDSHLLTPMLKELYEDVADLSDDIRHLAYQFHPSTLEDLGLVLSLRSLCEDFKKWEGVSINWELPDNARRFPQDVATCLYRVAQESLRNISRHAQASAVHLELKESKQGVTLSIHDNGRGFEVDGLLTRGLGFISMRERARLVDGIFTVESQPGKGTTVRVSIPLTGTRGTQGTQE